LWPPSVQGTHKGCPYATDDPSFMRLTAAALTLLVLCACSGSPSPRVTTEQDWDTDFAQYQTYAWRPGAAPGDPAMDSRIRDAVDFELMFKGLTKVEPAGAPDLHVSTYASADEALVIDLVDARSERLVWRGLAARLVDGQVPEAALRKVVRDIFRHYPGAG
jgi:Domain of unknown function (DUF4136)